MTLTLALPANELAPVKANGKAGEPTTVSTSGRVSRLRDEVKELREAQRDDLAEIKSAMAIMEDKLAKLDQWARHTLPSDMCGAIADILGEDIVPRIAKVETMPPMGVKWGGTWSADSYCEQGTLWIARGALWLCLRATDSKPGSSSESWRLIVKSGMAVADDEPRLRTATRSPPSGHRP
jgi:hypothetical protein